MMISNNDALRKYFHRSGAEPSRFHSHLYLIMMKRAHVNITIIVYANQRGASISLTVAKHFYVFLGFTALQTRATSSM